MKAIGAELFTTTGSGETIATFKRISAKEAGLKEWWFRDAIFANPELVISPCRSGGVVAETEQWYPWAREYAVADTGSIDVLLLSSQGRIGIVETKLSFNPERRREVVAQILDYAVALQETPLDFERLPRLSDMKVPYAPTQHDIDDALSAGKFLLIVAGDNLEPRAIRLGEAVLADHMTSEWDLAMVDLNLYEGGPERTRVLVPELRGRLIHETRQVVRVKVEGDQPRAKVTVERLPDPSRSDRKLWTGDAFSKELTEAPVSPKFRELIARFIDLSQRHAGVTIGYGTGKLGSITLRRAGGSLLSFFLDGRAETKPRDYIERALGPAGAQIYVAAIERLWGKEFVDGWKRPTAEQVIQQGAELISVLEQALVEAEHTAATASQAR